MWTNNCCGNQALLVLKMRPLDGSKQGVQKSLRVSSPTAMTGSNKDHQRRKVRHTDPGTSEDHGYRVWQAYSPHVASRAGDNCRGCYSSLLSDSMHACGSQVHTAVSIAEMVREQGRTSSLRGRFLLGQFVAFDERLEDEADGDLVDVLDILRVPITQGLGHGRQEWVLDVPEVFLLEALDLVV